jgi:hypothetical protein
MATEIAAIVEIIASQSQKEVTHGTGLRQLEGKLFRVIDRDVGTTPASPTNGDTYIVDQTGGAWSTATVKDIAHFFGGAWSFYTPFEGLHVWVNDEDILVVYDGTNWTIVTPTSGTWTPTLGFATPGDETVTLSTTFGSWTRNGDLVMAMFNLVTSTFTHTTASGNIEIGGLPVASANVANQVAKGILTWQGITNAVYTQVNLTLAPNASLMTLEGIGSGQTVTPIDEGDMPSAGSVILSGHILYKA